MKETEDKMLAFVLRHYQPGKLDTTEAIRRVAPHPNDVRESVIRRDVARNLQFLTWRRWAVAASVAAILLASAYAAYTLIGADSTVRGDLQSPRQEQPATHSPSRHFHFDGTPLPDVLRELGHHYGVTLTADQTEKRLTADFDSDSLHATIAMIEQVLSVRITVTPPPAPGKARPDIPKDTH